LKQHAWRTFLIGVLGFLLTLPWLVNAFSGQLVGMFQVQMGTSFAKLPDAAQQANSIGSLLDYLPAWAWLALALSVAWGLWRREKKFLLVVLWWLIILLLANPQWLNLPGVGVISSFLVMIAAYFPASTLTGAAVGWIVEWLEGVVSQNEGVKAVWGKAGRLLPAVVLLALVVFALWGAWQRKNDIRPSQFSLATRPDIRAAEWIKENLPEEAHFLTNSIFAYDGYAIVGTDGGWWLPLLAGRQVTTPPLNYTSESHSWPGYLAWTNALLAQIQEKGIDDPETLQELARRGVSHVYVGQLNGQVNNSLPLLKLDELQASTHFTPIYHQDRVWIFEINP
jgi:hypothetical protein